jgi:dihydrodipicolinate synthase/N-acetylneuraminate lyase
MAAAGGDGAAAALPCLLPARLLYAAAAAEAGCLVEATAYCAAVAAALRVDKGERPPPHLAVAAAQLHELRARLAGHAAALGLKARER